MPDITLDRTVTLTGRIDVVSELVRVDQVRASAFGVTTTAFEGYVRTLKFVYAGPWLSAVDPVDPNLLVTIGEVEQDLAEIVALLPRHALSGGWFTLVEQDADLSSGAGLWRLYLRPGGEIDRVSPRLVWPMRCQNPSCPGHRTDGGDTYSESCPDW